MQVFQIYFIILFYYLVARGFRTSNYGNPDESRAARVVLKDLVGAKILFCYPPPLVSETEFNEFNFSNTIESYSDRPKSKLQLDAPVDPFLEDESNVQVYVKQPTGRSNYSCLSGKSEANPEAKSSKKHFKMNKKK